MRTYQIGDNDAGQRLDSFLSKALPHMPQSLFHKLIRQKRIKLNGKRTEPSARLNTGDTVNIYVYEENLAPPPETEKAERWRSVEPRVIVVYEDEHILLADKVPGLLVHPDEDGGSEPTLIDHIQAYLYKKGEWDPEKENSFAPALCNRIDRNTGGIVVAAKTAAALRILNEKIRDHELEKTYLCVIHGRMEKSSGRLTDYIRRDLDEKRVYVDKKPSPGARTAILEYKTLAVKDELSLMQCRLITGRTHQIRAQFASAGHPLLGDGKYGTNAQNKAYGAKYQALYACRLAFKFKSDAGPLAYLNGRHFAVKNVPFAAEFGVDASAWNR
ncbi:MAG: RluA family pseudouridine synthase [Clostridia bacterium]|nr:RluA family pseudouridine synthase [Clostridia bacterium]